MLKHYLKTAIRNFRNNKLIFAGSIITVFLCVLCLSLLFTYIHNELTMDDFHKRKKDIYLMTVQQSPGSEIEAIMADLFFQFNYKDYPEIENLTSVKKYRNGDIVFKYGEKAISSEGIVADSMFLKIFDFRLKGGDNNILNDPNSVVISEKFALQLFGNDDPVGKMVKVTERREKVYTVNAIFEDLPSNSSIQFDFIIPNHSGSFSRSGGNFILVNDKFDISAFADKIKHLGNSHQQFKESQMGIISLDDIYFNEENTNLKGIFLKSGNK
ncbi:MAG: ABC transporter permease, partial [Prolixibacteraceae bacterium]|nr:ABC transporter permease [Prolixibacteraceae bacterium]